LPIRIAFVNADYYPSSLGGESSNIDCVIRVNRTVEFLFHCIVSKNSSYKAIKSMCAGNLASSCGSTLSRRLRYLGIKVTQSNFKQPAYSSGITCNQDLIGKKENYKFCSEGVLDKFKRLIDLSKGLSTYSFVNIVAPVRSNMSDEKIGPMTKNALETIAAKLNDMITRLEI
jgi:hypothetical protein